MSTPSLHSLTQTLRLIIYHRGQHLVLFKRKENIHLYEQRRVSTPTSNSTHLAVKQGDILMPLLPNWQYF